MVRDQFPLVLAEAITIHKSQGSSYETLTIELPSKNERSLLYVALARAVSVEHMYLIGKFKPPKPDPGPEERRRGRNGKIKIYPYEEMERLRNEATFVPRFAKLTDVPDGCYQIVSHNVHSMNAHAESISADTVVLASHIALFQETWLKTSDNVPIPNKTIIARNMLPDEKTTGKGTIIYASNQIDVESLGNFDRKDSTHTDITVCKLNDIIIINMYKSQQATIESFKKTLKKIKQYMREPNVVVCGDFNDDLIASDSTTKTFMDKYELKLLSPPIPTTDYGTCIDGVFGRLRDYSCAVTVYESYFSDHKPLVIRIFNDEETSTGLTQQMQTVNV